MPRRKKSRKDKMNKLVAFALTPGDEKTLREIAERRRITVSQLIREALHEHVLVEDRKGA